MKVFAQEDGKEILLKKLKKLKKKKMRRKNDFNKLVTHGSWNRICYSIGSLGLLGNGELK